MERSIQTCTVHSEKKAQRTQTWAVESQTLRMQSQTLGVKTQT